MLQHHRIILICDFLDIVSVRFTLLIHHNIEEYLVTGVKPQQALQIRHNTVTTVLLREFLADQHTEPARWLARKQLGEHPYKPLRRVRRLYRGWQPAAAPSAETPGRWPTSVRLLLRYTAVLRIIAGIVSFVAVLHATVVSPASADLWHGIVIRQSG